MELIGGEGRSASPNLSRFRFRQILALLILVRVYRQVQISGRGGTFVASTFAFCPTGNQTKRKFNLIPEKIKYTPNYGLGP